MTCPASPDADGCTDGTPCEGCPSTEDTPQTRDSPATKCAVSVGYLWGNKTARQSAPTLTPGLTNPHSKHRAEEG